MLAAALIAMLLLVGWSAPRADASARRVPHGFYGVDLNPQVVAGISPASLDSQMARMARSGVESLRVNFYWSEFEPGPNRFDWSVTDEIMSSAAAHGLQVLPVVEFTPVWASSKPTSSAPELYAPKDPKTYGAAMTALVKRYGPRGLFWSSNPHLRKDAITAWQIWNEPAGNWDWKTPHWARSYGALLKAGYKAVKAADRHALVVSAALVGATGGATPWSEATQLYKLGLRHYFDIVSINAYSGSPSVPDSVNRVIKIVSFLRNVMNHHGDAHKPIWMTEVTWTAALGKLRTKKQYIDIETTPKGQAQRLSLFMNQVASRPQGITRVFWYTWASIYQPTFTFGTSPTFQYAGLEQWRPNHPFKVLPLLGSFARAVVHLEGCHKKNTSGRCG
jgi:hypothetical protein